MINYYETLEIPTTATTEQINSAFEKLALRPHIESSLAEISEAYTVLSNDRKRKVYDQILILKSDAWENEDLLSEYDSKLAKDLVIIDDLQTQHSAFIARYKDTDPVHSAPLDVAPKAPDFFSSTLFSLTTDGLIFKPSEQPLNPEDACAIFKNSIQGKYIKSEYQKIQSYFRAFIDSNVLLVDADKIALYESIHTILTIINGSKNRENLAQSMRNIVRYAMKTINSSIEEEKLSFFHLLQDQAFKQLYTTTICEFLDKQTEMQLSQDIARFFISDLNEAFSDLKQLPDLNNYRHFVVQERIKTKYQAARTSSELRQLAFDCINFVPIFSFNQTAQVNLLLQAAFFLKKAAGTELDSAIVSADEELISIITLKMINITRLGNSFIDLYVHVHSVRLLSHLSKFSNVSLDFVNSLKEHIFYLVSSLPVVSETLSTLELIKQYGENTIFIHHYTQLVSQETKDTNSEMLYQQYEAAFKGEYVSADQSQITKQLRTDLMKSLLKDRGWSTADISKNVGSEWNVMNRDYEGWLSRGKLPYPDDVKTYKSIEGFTVNFSTGDIKFALPEWSESDPLHRKAFSEIEFQEALNLGISIAQYSLEASDPHMLMPPFHEERFDPQHLLGTHYLSAMRQADLLLKYYTSGYEVQGQPPFDARPIEDLIKDLPKHLKDIINNYLKNKTTLFNQRFWLEPSAMPIHEVIHVDNGTVVYDVTLSGPQMRVRTAPLTLAANKQLVDAPKEEGWPIYFFANGEELENAMQSKHISQEAIIIRRDNQQIFFCEKEILAPYTVALTDKQWEQLDHQPLNPLKQILITDDVPENRESYNSQFIYQLTTSITSQAKKPDYFSAERVFAEEFTAHYDEFSVCFPEFERIKQLSAVSCLVRKLTEYRDRNRSELDIIRSHSDQINAEKESYFSQAQPQLKSQINAELALVPRMMDQASTFYNNIKTFYANIGAHSPEVAKLYQSNLEDIKQQVIAQQGKLHWETTAAAYWKQQLDESWLPKWINELKISFMVNQKKEEIERYDYLKQIMTTDELNTIIDQYMTGNIEPLIFAIRNYNLDNLCNKLNQNFPGLIAHINRLNILTRDLDSITHDGAHFVAESLIVNPYIASIAEKERLDASFSSLGLMSKTEPKEDVSTTCRWLPACAYQKDNRGYVYGGVAIKPVLVTTGYYPFKAPPALSFVDPRTRLTDFKDFIGQKKTIKRAKGLVQGVSGAAQMAAGVGLAETGVFAPVGAAMFTLGVDNVCTGSKILVTGEDHQTLANEVLRATGLNETEAFVMEKVMGGANTASRVLGALSAVNPIRFFQPTPDAVVNDIREQRKEEARTKEQREESESLKMK